MSGSEGIASVVLERAEWRAREAAHEERADAFTAGWRARRATGESHPVDDFLFTYYPVKPSVLRRWHPGAGIALADAVEEPRARWKWYRPSDAGHDAGHDTGAGPRRAATVADGIRADDLRRGDESRAVEVDADAYATVRASSIAFIRDLLTRTAEREARFGCFGLHEWAMVYRLGADELRHRTPLRLSPAETDAVVEGHRIGCTHFDAFRFFTPEASPRNLLQPTRETQLDLEQPGCLHAGMDVYKWATKLGPLVPGELLLDAFELARDIRSLDMQASPYDVRDYGLPPVAIETDAGKRAYVAAQRGFAARGQALRGRLVAAIDHAHAVAGGAPSADAVARSGIRRTRAA